MKERSEKMSINKYSSRKSSSKGGSILENSMADTVTRMEIARLHEQVHQLQAQLKKVEERQDELARH